MFSSAACSTWSRDFSTDTDEEFSGEFFMVDYLFDDERISSATGREGIAVRATPEMVGFEEGEEIFEVIDEFGGRIFSVIG